MNFSKFYLGEIGWGHGPRNQQYCGAIWTRSNDEFTPFGFFDCVWNVSGGICADSGQMMTETVVLTFSQHGDILSIFKGGQSIGELELHRRILQRIRLYVSVRDATRNECGNLRMTRNGWFRLDPVLEVSGQGTLLSPLGDRELILTHRQPPDWLDKDYVVKNILNERIFRFLSLVSGFDLSPSRQPENFFRHEPSETSPALFCQTTDKEITVTEDSFYLFLVAALFCRLFFRH